MKKIIILVAVLMIFSGCDSGFQQMGPTEYGIRFRNLPTFLGGGVASSVHEPGSLAVVWPWETIIRFDTAVKGISWGAADPAAQSKTPQYVATRALDGNEVALAVTVRYQIKPDTSGLVVMAQEVAVNNVEVENLVKAVANADIRTYMNELHTSEYLARDDRYVAVDKVRESIKKKLERFNIEVLAVNLDDFRFERILEDGTADSSYQDKLNETQRYREETEREKARIDTVIAKKQQEYNDTQAKVNRQVAEADGYKAQAILRGDAYLQTRSNQAKGTLATGKAEVEGLIERINALSGPGGRALLKLELAKNIMKNNPQFVVVGSGTQSTSLDVRRTDTNEILRQAGVFEALQSRNDNSASGINENQKKRGENLPQKVESDSEKNLEQQQNNSKGEK